ncbi:hypothetical protein [Paraburkholderia guartelaensis]|uniref:hypothetical protein n=1 Tax=Paraburkholderia guartelaensis TaxID=2546446 RepID=UPI003CCC4F51
MNKAKEEAIASIRASKSRSQALAEKEVKFKYGMQRNCTMRRNGSSCLIDCYSVEVEITYPDAF